MNVQKEISLRNAISYCIENNDVNTATNRIMEFIRDEKEAINFIQCSTQLKSENVISFEDWKKRFVVKTETKDVYELRGNFISGETLMFAYSKDVELINSLIV